MDGNRQGNEQMDRWMDGRMDGRMDGWMYVRTSYVYGWMYVCRVKAGGSPEANCILFVWIWKMLILHCVLQCFMFFSESVRSAKVSMSARINLTFVRAEK